MHVETSVAEVNGELFVVADDFGISHRINEAILHAIDRELVHAVGVTPNGPAVEQGIEELASYRGTIILGAHLCVTAFSALSKEAQESQLCNSRGQFDCDRAKLGWFHIGQLRVLARELEEQLWRCKSFGLEVEFINSHEHFHSTPIGWLAVALVSSRAREMGVRYVRPTQTVFLKPETPTLPKRAAKRLYNRSLRQLGFGTASEFGTLTALLENRSLVAECLAKNFTVECMVHPGNPGYVAENRLLFNGGISQLL